MGEARHAKKVIDGLEAQKAEHLDKIQSELDKATPDLGTIEHWRREIRGWDKRIDKLQGRLEKRRRRG